MKFFLTFLVSLNLFSYDPAYTQSKNELPLELKDMKIIEKTGQSLDLGLKFKNEMGQEIELRSLFKKDIPVLLTIVYYRCPTLCGYHLSGLQNVLKELEWNVGREYQFVAVSMDATEKSDLAKNKRDAFVQDYAKSGKDRKSEVGWNFLTGDAESISKLAASVGFPYRFNVGLKQWIHPAVAYVITPEGKISRYLHGIAFDSKELKLSFIDAANGKIGNFIDKFTMFCFKFDPEKNKYTLYAYNIMKIGGLLTVLLISGFLFSFWRAYSKTKINQGEL